MKNISNKRSKIESEIRNLENKDFDDCKWSSDVIRRLIDLSVRGKMFRGVIFLSAVESMDGPEALEYAAAIELVHTGLLIHDDVMDDDEMRRGETALHKQYQREMEASSKTGENMAICAADVAFFLAFELITTSENFEPEAARIFSRTFCKTGMGQMTDIEMSVPGAEPTRSEIEKLYTNKTALYTFSMPLQMASIVSGNGKSEKLDDIGTELGVLYQLRDDSLDIFETDNTTGKPSKSDIKENKKTLHRKFLIESSENKKEVKKLFAGETNDEEASQAVNLMKENSIDEKVDSEIESRKKELKDKINSLENDNTAEVLDRTIEIALERNR